LYLSELRHLPADVQFAWKLTAEISQMRTIDSINFRKSFKLQLLEAQACEKSLSINFMKSLKHNC
jgi:hypothetical protein